jgi:hypothetical protein
MSKLTITCEDFKPLRRNTLCGFATIKVEALRLTIKNIAIHEKNGRRWAQLPAKPQIKDGKVITDSSGKAQYAIIMQFDSREVSDAFSDAVIAAVLQHNPRAFDADEGQKPVPHNDFHSDPIPF